MINKSLFLVLFLIAFVAAKDIKVCNAIAEQVKLLIDNKIPNDRIQKMVLQACWSLPNHFDSCKDFVDANLQATIESIQSGKSPKETCKGLNLFVIIVG
jgi:uncharacterized membrane protein